MPSAVENAGYSELVLSPMPMVLDIMCKYVPSKSILDEIAAFCNEHMNNSNLAGMDLWCP